MGRRLSGWLVLARLFQILGSFIPGAMNGWLLYYIATNKLGPSKLMLVLEILVCLGTHWSCILCQPRHELSAALAAPFSTLNHISVHSEQTALCCSNLTHKSRSPCRFCTHRSHF